MPESIVAVTEGAGKKLHTWQRTIGANTVEDEYVLLGENGLASYVTTCAASTATAASHLIQIMAGASLRVRIRRIEVYQTALATTAALGSIALYRLTSAGTGGGALALPVLDPADGACGAAAMTLPGAKGAEGALIANAGVYFLQTAGASVAFQSPLIVWNFDQPRSKPLVIAAGVTNGIALKMETAHAAGQVRINVWFDESSF